MESIRASARSVTASRLVAERSRGSQSYGKESRLKKNEFLFKKETDAWSIVRPSLSEIDQGEEQPGEALPRAEQRAVAARRATVLYAWVDAHGQWRPPNVAKRNKCGYRNNELGMFPTSIASCKTSLAPSTGMMGTNCFLVSFR